MDANLKTKVETLLDKATTADDATQAMHFAQAAANAANAVAVLANIERSDKPPQT